LIASMNKEQLRKNVGHWVRLRPIAHRLDFRGMPLPQIDDEWKIESVLDDGVRLFLPRTGHVRLLAFDNLCEYTKDRFERGMHYAFLTLKVQLSIQGNDVHVTPTRPGVPVPPTIPPDPIRLALLQRLRDFPGTFIPAGDLVGFEHRAVIDEIARCDAEALVEARLLRGGPGILDAVALGLKPRGAEWLRQHGVH
jgi:hypothetical protein